MNVSEKKLLDIKCCAQETMLIVSELQTLEKEIFLHRDLTILLLKYIPNEFQNIDKIVQRLTFISNFLSDLSIEDFSSVHESSINLCENSLFSKLINENK